MSWPAGSRIPTLEGVATVAMARGEQFLVYINGGAIEIKATVGTDSDAHGVVDIDIPAGGALDDANVRFYGELWPAIAGEALVKADALAALTLDAAGRLEKGAGPWQFFPIFTSANPTGAAADGDLIFVIRKAA